MNWFDFFKEGARCRVFVRTYDGNLLEHDGIVVKNEAPYYVETKHQYGYKEIVTKHYGLGNIVPVDFMVLAFDSYEWGKKGDVGDNSIYFKKALVIGLRASMLRGVEVKVADLEFPGGRLSHGHFMEELIIIK
jgi:hypothetical protein